MRRVELCLVFPPQKDKNRRHMKEQIENLIQQYRESRIEVWNLLEELSQIETTKLDYKEVDSLRSLKTRYEEEYTWKGVFISELENLL